MRIAMLGHKRVPSREGGVEVVVEELSVRMAAKGHQVTLYNRSGHHVSGREFDGEKLREYKGITLKTVPAINVKGIAAMTASELAFFQLNDLRSSFRLRSLTHGGFFGCGVNRTLKHAEIIRTGRIVISHSRFLLFSKSFYLLYFSYVNYISI